MNIFKSSLLSLFAFSLLIAPSFSFAVEPTKTTTASPVTLTGQAVVVSEVNITEGRIMSQDGSTFNIAFSISNGKGLQAGVKYGVLLMSETGNYIVDEKVYDEVLTLAENSVTKKEVTYVAPKELSGSYKLLIKAGNESNFPFGIALLGNIKISSTVKGVTIDSSSCYLQVEGEKNGPHYTLSQNVGISSDEKLKLTCTATNLSDKAVTLTPFFETRYYNSFGKISAQTGGDYNVISFAKGEKKNLSLVLPKGISPQSYSLKVSLMNSDFSSNSLKVNYLMTGINATIQKLSLDKDYYGFGDKGEISILWSASSGNSSRSGPSNNSIPKVSLTAKITGENGLSCAPAIKQDLVRSADSQTKISFKAKSSCVNPKVSASILDERGNVLDQKEFNFITGEGHGPKPLSTKSIIIVVALLIVIVGLFMVMKKKKTVAM